MSDLHVPHFYIRNEGVCLDVVGEFQDIWVTWDVEWLESEAVQGETTRWGANKQARVSAVEIRNVQIRYWDIALGGSGGHERREVDSGVAEEKIGYRIEVVLPIIDVEVLEKDTWLWAYSIES